MKTKIYLVLHIEVGTGKVIGSIEAFKNYQNARRMQDQLNEFTMHMYNRCEYIIETHDLQ